MRYDVEAIVCEEIIGKDAMGGQTISYSPIKTIHCAFSPIQSTLIDDPYLRQEKEVMKVVTADALPQTTSYVLKINDFYYKPYYERYFLRRAIVMVEKVKSNG